MFENLYYVGFSDVGAWVIPTSDGIILFDALNNADEGRDVLVGGLKKVGLDPAQIKYLIIGHGHNDHTGGGLYIQNTYKPRDPHGRAGLGTVVAGERPDRPVMKRDMDVTDGQKVTLGDTTVTLMLTPGHTPGHHRNADAREASGTYAYRADPERNADADTRVAGRPSSTSSTTLRKSRTRKPRSAHTRTSSMNKLPAMEALGRQYPDRARIRCSWVRSDSAVTLTSCSSAAGRDSRRSRGARSEGSLVEMRYWYRPRQTRTPKGAAACGRCGDAWSGSVAGDEYLRDMEHARELPDGRVRWIEVCFCSTPLAEERPVLGRVFRAPSGERTRMPAADAATPMATNRGRAATATALTASNGGCRGRGSHFNPEDRPLRKPGNGNNRPVDRHPKFVKVTGARRSDRYRPARACRRTGAETPALVEAWFSTGIYPAIQRTVTPFSNTLPVAVLDILIVAAVLAMPWRLCECCGRAAARAAWRHCCCSLAGSWWPSRWATSCFSCSGGSTTGASRWSSDCPSRPDRPLPRRLFNWA